MIAASVALLPFTGRLWGRRDVAGIRRAFREVSWTSFLYVTLVVAPITLFAGAALVAPLAESPLTREMASFGVLLVPLACLASLGFFACRPIFEGMQLGQPGLVVALVRYVLLTPPGALAGAALARGAGLTAFHGAIAGVIVATALSSVLFVAWMRRQLDRAEREARAGA
jgi:Na+-driven multidrug efflux pump